MTENLSEIDKEALVLLVKEKAKEVKSLEAKNKKLEERYIKVFRENKNFVKDRETLEKFLSTIFDHRHDALKSTEVGTYDIAALNELWDQRKGKELSNIDNNKENYQNEKFQKRTAELEKELEKIKLQIKPESGKMLESYKAQILELENANKKLKNETKQLNDIIEKKDREISNLKNLENEIDSLKAELFVKELEIKNTKENVCLKTKMQENERKNELLRLKQDIEALQGIIKQLQSKKVELMKANVKNQSVQTYDEELALISHDKSPKATSHDSLPKPTFERRDSHSSHTNFSENGQVNQEYLKNILLKLFCYIEGNNLNEAKVLMNAICIILKMSPEDRHKIEEAKKNNNLWASTVSFFKGTFTAKGDINYHTVISSQK